MPIPIDTIYLNDIPPSASGAIPWLKQSYSDILMDSVVKFSQEFANMVNGLKSMEYRLKSFYFPNTFKQVSVGEFPFRPGWIPLVSSCIKQDITTGLVRVRTNTMDAPVACYISLFLSPDREAQLMQDSLFHYYVNHIGYGRRRLDDLVLPILKTFRRFPLGNSVNAA